MHLRLRILKLAFAFALVPASGCDEECNEQNNLNRYGDCVRLAYEFENSVEEIPNKGRLRARLLGSGSPSGFRAESTNPDVATTSTDISDGDFVVIFGNRTGDAEIRVYANDSTRFDSLWIHVN